MIGMSRLVILLVGLYQITGLAGKVIEMDDRIIDFSTQGKWLVTFYAPWCGHCRKLEPIMEEVSKYYSDRGQINIAKIDATQFHKSANHFEIKAYPTIKFISGKKVIDYSGERRRDDIIDFISKAESPRVTKTLNQIDFEHSKTKHKLFFLLVSSPEDSESKLTKLYYDLANIYFLDAYFYHATPEQIKKTADVGSTPIVGVIKENEFFEHDPNVQPLEAFVQNERFLTFGEVTMSNFHKLIETKKNLIILNLNSENKVIEKQTRKLKRSFSQFSKLHRQQTHKEFLFGYVDKSDLLNGVAIWSLPAPLLFIFNTSTYTYSVKDLIDEKSKVLFDLDISEVLNDIRNDKLEIHGGHSYFRQLRRPLWELYRAIIEMFFEAPFLSLLIFGFPFSVISIVFYFLCCADSSDQPDDEFNSDSDDDLNEEQYYLDEEIRNAQECSENKKDQ